MFDMGCHAAGSIGRENSPDEAAVDQAFAMAGCLARDLVPDSADQASMHFLHSILASFCLLTRQACTSFIHSVQLSIPLFADLLVYLFIPLFTQLLVGSIYACIHSFIHSFIQLFTYASRHSCNRQLSQSHIVLIGSL